jgi:hypothetical protein
MLYCDTTALRVERRISAIAPSVWGVAVPAAVIGMLRSALSESIWYCGVCITIE